MTLRTRADRHARFRRAVVDGRRRPVDGFRTASTRRFDRLVGEVVATLPPDLLEHLDAVRVTVEEVPEGPGLGEVPLGRLTHGHLEDALPADPADAPAAGRLTLYRRPLEGRARDRAELTELIRLVIVHEVADHLGLDDDHLDELGWS